MRTECLGSAGRGVTPQLSADISNSAQCAEFASLSPLHAQHADGKGVAPSMSAAAASILPQKRLYPVRLDIFIYCDCARLRMAYSMVHQQLSSERQNKMHDGRRSCVAAWQKGGHFHNQLEDAATSEAQPTESIVISRVCLAILIRGRSHLWHAARPPLSGAGGLNIWN